MNSAAPVIGNWHSESDTPRLMRDSLVPIAEIAVLVLRALLAVAPIAVEYQQKRKNAQEGQDEENNLGACREGQDKPT